MLLRRASLHFGLLFSGAAALLYESTWTRMLHQVFGVSDLAVATVLAAFFMGLGIGGALGGRLAARTSRPALAYAAIEIAVAVLAIASIVVVPSVRTAYESVAVGASFPVLTLLRWTFASLVLLPPTILMGATIPVLARAAAHDASWSRDVTSLYVANTFGAIAGAAIAGLWSIPTLGLRASIATAAAASVAAALIVGTAARTMAPAAPAAVAAPAPGDPTVLRLATSLALLSGATSLAGEVLWTRVLRIVLHGTTTAFAAMLINYLAGIAIGAALSPRLARRFGARRAFGAIQLGVALAFAFAVAFAPNIPRIIPLLRHAPAVVAHEPSVILLVSSLLLGPLAILTGTGLPLTWAILEEAQPDAAAGSGRLLAANTLGALTGALGAGFFLVPAIGTEASLIVVIVLCALASALALRSAAHTLRARVLALALPALALVAVFAVRPSIELPFLLAVGDMPLDRLIAGPGDAWRRDLVFLEEGRNTTVSVRRHPGGLALFNDGRPESGFGAGPVGFGPELVLLAGLPAMFAEEQGDALIVGLGAGHTTAVALAGGFRQVTAVELEPAVVDAARLLYEARDRPFPLDDPRARLVVDDGRNQLSVRPPASLDAIISQPSHPWLAGSAALYTTEFFEEAQRALRPGGVLGIWVNLFRTDVEAIRSVVGTLSGVYRNVMGFYVEGATSSLLFVASDRPFDWQRAEQRFGALAPLLEPLGLPHLASVAASLEIDETAARTLGEGVERVTDNRPVLEFRLARRPQTEMISISAIDHSLASVPWLGGHSSLARARVLEPALRERIDRVAWRRIPLDRMAAAVAGVDGPARGELDGRLAEARGDRSAALRAYASSRSPGAALAEDRLRAADGEYEALVARARVRGVAPELAGPLVEAALELDRPDVLTDVLAIARRVGHPSERGLVDSATAYSQAGCAGLLAQEDLDATTWASAALARLAQRCALIAGDRARVTAMEQRAWRIRTVLANDLTARGNLALQGGNGGLAWALLARALRVYPTSSAASIALASLHVRDGRRELAREVLLRAWTASEGLRDARQRVAVAAAQLGLDLSAHGVAIEADVSSAAPSTAATTSD